MKLYSGPVRKTLFRLIGLDRSDLRFNKPAVYAVCRKLIESNPLATLPRGVERRMRAARISGARLSYEHPVEHSFDTKTNAQS